MNWKSYTIIGVLLVALLVCYFGNNSSDDCPECPPTQVVQVETDDVTPAATQTAPVKIKKNTKVEVVEISTKVSPPPPPPRLISGTTTMTANTTPAATTTIVVQGSSGVNIATDKGNSTGGNGNGHQAYHGYQTE